MRPLHPNFRIASNFCRASALLTVLAYFFSEVTSIMPGMLMVGVPLVAAYLIRAGLKWFKWVLLVWVVYNLQAFLSLISQPWEGSKTTLGLLILVVVLQVIAVVYLFLPIKDATDREIDEDNEQEDTTQ